MEPKFGLVGKNISYSFSKSYFTEKFLRNNINASYENFDIPEVFDFFKVKKTPHLAGLNVTIPYKEAIIPYLDQLDHHAAQIGAVNTIKIEPNGSLTGYNTDFIGFTRAIEPLLQPQHQKALILGTGGASKAIAYALDQLRKPYFFVSRKKHAGTFLYSEIDEKILQDHLIIINCTPLGTFPKTEEVPPIPTEFFGPQHLVFDLIYNPEATKLLQAAQRKKAVTSNGLKMLQIQAEEAWKIWNF